MRQPSKRHDSREGADYLNEGADSFIPSVAEFTPESDGAPPSTVIMSVTWRAASAGIVTGIILALARIAGETAPLLFTALNNNSWFSANLMGGVANLPVMIYQFALSPYPNWQGLAWAGALLITATILALSIIARLVIKPQASR